MRTAQGVERQRVELDEVVRADVRAALDVGLVEALQARRRGRIRACQQLRVRLQYGKTQARGCVAPVMLTWADGSVKVTSKQCLCPVLVSVMTRSERSSVGWPFSSVPSEYLRGPFRLG